MEKEPKTYFVVMNGNVYGKNGMFTSSVEKARLYRSLNAAIDRAKRESQYYRRECTVIDECGDEVYTNKE